MMHRALTAIIDQRNRLLALTEELGRVLAKAEPPALDKLNDIRRRLMMAVIRLQRHKDEAVMPWAYAAGDVAKAWAADVRAREVILYRRFDEFEDAWPDDRALTEWAEFRKQGVALIDQCRALIAYSVENLYPLLAELSFDYKVDEIDTSEIDWEAERWKILRRYPRL